MPESTPQAPPPPPPTAYSPYPAAQAPATSSGSGVKLPPWLDLWSLLGLLVIFVGAILILVGFLFGDAAVSATGPGGSASTYQSDLEAFFVWSGVGIFLTILGWLLRIVMAMWRGSKGAASASAASTATAAPAVVAASPAPPATAAAPAAPACVVCGKPTTYIAQYGRYYCYADARYV